MNVNVGSCRGFLLFGIVGFAESDSVAFSFYKQISRSDRNDVFLQWVRRVLQMEYFSFAVFFLYLKTTKT